MGAGSGLKEGNLMGEWTIIVAALAAFYIPFVRKLDSLELVHLEWGLVLLKFTKPQKKVKQPTPAKVQKQLKQVRQLPR